MYTLAVYHSYWQPQPEMVTHSHKTRPVTSLFDARGRLKFRLID